MKYLKIPGLAVLAVLALMAFVGTGAASAETTVCKTTEDPCTEANMYPVGTEIHATLKAGTEAVLKSGFGSIKCKKASVVGKSETTTTPEGKAQSWTFTECNCQVTVVESGKLQVHWDAEHNGTLTLIGFKITVGGPGITCFLINNFDCTYQGNVETGFTAKGGDPGTAIATEAKVPQVGGTSGELVCGKEGKFSAEFEVTSPKPGYVSKGI